MWWLFFPIINFPNISGGVVGLGASAVTIAYRQASSIAHELCVFAKSV